MLFIVLDSQNDLYTDTMAGYSSLQSTTPALVEKVADPLLGSTGLKGTYTTRYECV